MIRLQREDFDFAQEVATLSAGNKSVGGVCAFTGLVREIAGDTKISAMTLEHYPGMTEKALTEIEAQAQARWPLEKTLIIHRYGRLEPADQIVLVAASSAHRDAAFDACRFLIDWLKTEAPFWKLEECEKGANWVEAKDSDTRAQARWLEKNQEDSSD